MDKPSVIRSAHRRAAVVVLHQWGVDERADQVRRLENLRRSLTMAAGEDDRCVLRDGLARAERVSAAGR